MRKWGRMREGVLPAQCPLQPGLQVNPPAQTLQLCTSKLTLADAAAVVIVPELHRQCDDDPDDDGDEAHRADAVHDDLEVGHVVGAADEGSSPASQQNWTLSKDSNDPECQSQASRAERKQGPQNQISLEVDLTESYMRESHVLTCQRRC